MVLRLAEFSGFSTHSSCCRSSAWLKVLEKWIILSIWELYFRLLFSLDNSLDRVKQVLLILVRLKEIYRCEHELIILFDQLMNNLSILLIDVELNERVNVGHL